MENIREVISKNIIMLRKQHCLTQVDLSKKINFSDKAISRWEKGEVMPDVETLECLSKVFDVPIGYFFESHEINNQAKQKPSHNEIILYALMICIVWFVITLAFVYLIITYNYVFWQGFVWAIPISCIFVLQANKKWGNNIFKVIVQSIFVWTLIASIYLQFLQNNLWLIFLIGIPIQAAIVLASFIRSKPKDY